MTITFFRSIGIRWAPLRSFSSVVILLLAVTATGRGAGTCDLNVDGQVNVVDVQVGLNQSLGVAACTTADVNLDSQCNVVDVQLLINTALGSACPAQSTTGSPGAWVSGFTPVRTHYVTPNGSGSQNGTIGNPESFATALGHHQCGDLHVARGGTYTVPGGGDYLKGDAIAENCSSSAPKVWKGYVGPDGQPENARWTFGIFQPRRWHWFVGLHHDLSGVTESDVYALQSRHSGVRIINAVAHDSTGSVLGFFRTAGTAEPKQVVYGTVSYRPAVTGHEVQPAHPVYAQNHYPTDGYKYFVQNIFLEPHTDGGRRVWQANDSHGDRGVSGFWLERNFFGDANPVNQPGEKEGQTLLFSVSSTDPTFNRTDRIVLHRNFMVDFFHSSSLRRSIRAADEKQPWVGTVTDNYMARANFHAGAFWGHTDSHHQYVFTGNEIFDPPDGVHIDLITRASTGTPGSHRIPNQDNWNNNVYGGTFKARLNCNGTNFGDRTLAQWRAATDGCRVTPGSAEGFDVNSTNPGNPTSNKVEVVKNEYQCPNGCPFTDQARGNIYCVNWANSSTCSANISSVVGPGKQYVVRYPRDFFGTPAASGICPGSGACNVSLPTKRTNADSTGRFANAYVITAQP